MELQKYIDHSLLRPDATPREIQRLCEEAMDHGFFGVCVHGCHTLFARYLLRHSPVKLITVVGFPLGAMSTEAKVCEARDALENGADELDMVINLGALKALDDAYVVRDIAKVKQLMGTRPLKVIIESAALNPAEIRKACECVMEAGADFVKTSTGFGTGGASQEAVRLIRSVVGDRLKIKASGGISDRATALEFLALGVHRLGTSSGPALMKTS